MVSINPAFQVLVVSNNIAALAAGSPVSALAPGQIGFFSYETNLSIDGTVLSSNRSFYIAVGIDPLNTGSVTDILKSAGNTIQQKGIRAFTSKPYTAPQNKIIQLKVGAVSCNTEYGVRFEIRGEKQYSLYGYNGPYKSFTGYSNACTDQCVDCAAGDPNSVVQALGTEINYDPDGILLASYVSPTTGGTISSVPEWVLGYNSLAPPVAPAGTPTTGTGSAAAHTYYGRVTVINADGESLPGPESTGIVLSATGEISWTWTAVVAPAGQPAVTGYKLYVGIAPGAETSWFATSTNSFLQTATTGTTGALPTGAAATVGNANAALVAILQVNVLPDALYAYSSINLQYFDPRQINVYMSLLSDPNSPNGFGTFGPDTTQADLQEIIYEDGSGYDIQQLEYQAGGWNGNPGPYRTSELVGVPVKNTVYYSTQSGTYQLYAITNENKGIGAGAEYKSSNATYIAVPSANSTALNSVNATLHRLIDGATGNDSTVNAAYPVATAYNSGVIA